MELNDFAIKYLCLGLRINKHIDGYVEHYYGPPKLKKMVDMEEKCSPIILLKDCRALIAQLPKQGFEKKRHNFLDKTLTAIETTLRTLNGEKIPYLEQVEKLFDFKPMLYDDNFFYSLTSKADELYKGEGPLSERIKKYAKQRTIPPDLLKNLFMNALHIAQKRTKQFFPNLLPDNEDIEIVEVEDQSWPWYCWYQGNYVSKIEINISTFHYWTYLLNSACHEGYPGHHTERVVRENLLYRTKGYFESAILLIYSPEMVISEGIGVTAESVLFDHTERARILLEKIHPNPKIEDTLETLIKQSEVREGFRRFESNLAYHKYVHKWSDDKLIKYAKSFKVIPDMAIKSILGFISNKLWAPYAFTYQGERLITEKFGNRPSPKHFRRLLTEQTLPSDLL
jgi:hypothetical protein